MPQTVLVYLKKHLKNKDNFKNTLGSTLLEEETRANPKIITLLLSIKMKRLDFDHLVEVSSESGMVVTHLRQKASR